MKKFENQLIIETNVFRTQDFEDVYVISPQVLMG